MHVAVYVREMLLTGVSRLLVIKETKRLQKVRIVSWIKMRKPSI